MRTRQKKKAQEEVKEDEGPPGSSALTVYLALAPLNSDYQFRDSFILDSGSNGHICNRHSRLQNLRPASEDDFLYAGNTIIPIESFGTATITVQTPRGSEQIRLENVALVPSFHTNVASLRRFKA